MEYLIILGVFLAVTLILEKVYRVHLYHNLKERIEITLLFFIIGIIWDTLAIWRGHWIFPAEKNLGIVIGLMPLEEYLFALIIPYFIITIYKVIGQKFRNKKNKS